MYLSLFIAMTINGESVVASLSCTARLETSRDTSVGAYGGETVFAGTEWD